MSMSPRCLSNFSDFENLFSPMNHVEKFDLSMAFIAVSYCECCVLNLRGWDVRKVSKWLSRVNRESASGHWGVIGVFLATVYAFPKRRRYSQRVIRNASSPIDHHPKLNFTTYVH